MSRLALVFAVSATLALSACEGGGSLVGTWQAVEADSLGMRYTFFGDGTARFVERPREGEPTAYEARYEVLGDSLLALRWIDGAAPDARFRIAFDGDTLRLTNPAGGRRTVWVRM